MATPIEQRNTPDSVDGAPLVDTENTSRTLAIEVSPTPVTLMFAGENGTRKSVYVRHGYHKVGVAVLAGLSLIDVQRHRHPWLNSKAIVESADGYLTPDQLQDRVLEPLRDAGALDTERGSGYRLRTDPLQLLAALASTQRVAPFSAEAFDQWYTRGVQQRRYPAVCLLDRYRPIVAAIASVSKRGMPTDKLDMEQIAFLAGLSLDRTWRMTRELVGTELIHPVRPGAPYLVGHISPVLHHVALKQRERIFLAISAEGIKKYTPDRKILDPRARLYEQARHDTLWIDAGADVADMDDVAIAQQVQAVMETPLVWTTISTRNYHYTIYQGDFPDIDGIPKAQTLTMLDTVGVGPVLLRRLKDFSGPGTSLVARLERLEQRGDIADVDMVLTIRAKLLQLADPSISFEQARVDARDYSFTDCLDLVSLRQDEVPQPQVVTEPTVVFTAKRKKREKYTHTDTDKKIQALRSVIGPQLDHEIGSVDSNTIMPAAEMMPVQAYQFHDTLRRVMDTRTIPWEQLSSLGLAKLNVERNSGHSVFSRVGALITSLFMYKGIREELLKTTRKKADSIVLLSQQVSHMLARRVVDQSSSKRAYDYATACLTELLNNEKKDLVCLCSFCQAVHESIQ